MLQPQSADFIKQLKQSTGISRPMALPSLTKLVVNCRVPDAKDSQEALAAAVEEIAQITGQKPSLCLAKKSVSTFKVRYRDPLALKVTLRGRRMYHFIEKLFNLVLPRLRDFKGLSTSSFDGHGSYNLTIKDHTNFPEVNLNKVNKIRSLQVTLCLRASSQEHAKMLLSALGLPWKK
jgi:large subunit ribosomal protein L5